MPKPNEINTGDTITLRDGKTQVTVTGAAPVAYRVRWNDQNGEPRYMDYWADEEIPATSPGAT